MPPVRSKLNKETLSSPFENPESEAVEDRDAQSHTVTLAFLGCPSSTAEIILKVADKRERAGERIAKHESGVRSRRRRNVNVSSPVDISVCRCSSDQHPARSEDHHAQCKIHANDKMYSESALNRSLDSGKSLDVEKRSNETYQRFSNVSPVAYKTTSSGRSYHTTVCEKADDACSEERENVMQTTVRHAEKEERISTQVSGEDKKSTSISPRGSRRHAIPNPSSSTCDTYPRKKSGERGGESKVTALPSQRVRLGLRAHKHKLEGRHTGDDVINSATGSAFTDLLEVDHQHPYLDHIEGSNAHGDTEIIRHSLATDGVESWRQAESREAAKTKYKTEVADVEHPLLEAQIFTEEEQQYERPMRENKLTPSPQRSPPHMRSRSRGHPTLDKMFVDVVKILLAQSSQEGTENLEFNGNENTNFQTSDFSSTHQPENCYARKPWPDAEYCEICVPSNEKYVTNRDVSSDSNGNFPECVFKAKLDLDKQISTTALDSGEQYRSSPAQQTSPCNRNCHHCFDDDQALSCEEWDLIDPEPSSGESSSDSFGSREDLNAQVDGSMELEEKCARRLSVREMVKNLQDRLDAFSRPNSAPENGHDGQHRVTRPGASSECTDTERRNKEVSGPVGNHQHVTARHTSFIGGVGQSQENDNDQRNATNRSRTDGSKASGLPVFKSRVLEESTSPDQVGEKISIVVTSPTPVSDLPFDPVESPPNILEDSEKGHEQLQVPETITFALTQHPEVTAMEELELEKIAEYRKRYKKYETLSLQDEVDSPEQASSSCFPGASEKDKKDAMTHKTIASYLERARAAITRVKLRSHSPGKLITKLNTFFGMCKYAPPDVTRSWSISDVNEIEAGSSTDDFEAADVNGQGSSSNNENNGNFDHRRRRAQQVSSDTSVMSGDAHPPIFCLRISDITAEKKYRRQFSRSSAFRGHHAFVNREEIEVQQTNGSKDNCFPQPECSGAVWNIDHSEVGMDNETYLQSLYESSANFEDLPTEHIISNSDWEHGKQDATAIKQQLMSDSLDSCADPDQPFSSLSSTALKLRSPILECIEELDSENLKLDDKVDENDESSDKTCDATIASSCHKETCSNLKCACSHDEQVDDRRSTIQSCASCSDCKRETDDVSLHEEVSSSAPVKTHSLVNACDTAHTESGVTEVMALISQEVKIKRYPSFPDLTDINDEEDIILAAKDSGLTMQGVSDQEVSNSPGLQQNFSPITNEEVEQSIVREVLHKNKINYEDCSCLNGNPEHFESPLKHIVNKEEDKSATQSCTRCSHLAAKAVSSPLELCTNATNPNSSCDRTGSLLNTTKKPKRYPHIISLSATNQTAGEFSEPHKMKSDTTVTTNSSEMEHQMDVQTLFESGLPSPPNHTLSEGSKHDCLNDSSGDTGSSSAEEAMLSVAEMENAQSTSTAPMKSERRARLKRLRQAVIQDYKHLTEEPSSAQANVNTTSDPGLVEEKLLIEDSEVSLELQASEGSCDGAQVNSDSSLSQECPVNLRESQTKQGQYLMSVDAFGDIVCDDKKVVDSRIPYTAGEPDIYRNAKATEGEIDTKDKRTPVGDNDRNTTSEEKSVLDDKYITQKSSPYARKDLDDRKECVLPQPEDPHPSKLSNLLDENLAEPTLSLRSSSPNMREGHFAPPPSSKKDDTVGQDQGNFIEGNADQNLSSTDSEGGNPQSPPIAPNATQPEASNTLDFQDGDALNPSLLQPEERRCRKIRWNDDLFASDREQEDDESRNSSDDSCSDRCNSCLEDSQSNVAQENSNSSNEHLVMCYESIPVAGSTSARKHTSSKSGVKEFKTKDASCTIKYSARLPQSVLMRGKKVQNQTQKGKSQQNSVSVTLSEVVCSNRLCRSPLGKQQHSCLHLNTPAREYLGRSELTDAKAWNPKSDKTTQKWMITPTSKIFGATYQYDSKEENAAKAKNRYALLRQIPFNTAVPSGSSYVAKGKKKCARRSSTENLYPSDCNIASDTAILYSKCSQSQSALSSMTSETKLETLPTPHGDAGGSKLNGHEVMRSCSQLSSATISSSLSLRSVADQDTYCPTESSGETSTETSVAKEESTGSLKLPELESVLEVLDSPKLESSPASSFSGIQTSEKTGILGKLSQRLQRTDRGFVKAYDFAGRSQRHMERCNKLIERSTEIIGASQKLINRSKKQMEFTSKTINLKRKSFTKEASDEFT